MDLLKELKELLRQFEDQQIDYALCGGLAMAVYAFPRATLDIDILIEPQSLESVRSIANQLGYTIDVGSMEFNAGAIRIYRFTKIHEASADAIPLDLLLVTPQIKEVWNDRCHVEWNEGQLSVVSPEGLIALKSLRGSGQDQDDIKKLREIIDEG
ncbi:MAG: hypothetical protein C4527_13030 [Candidatus Omnitrophota bacterium]|jgi:predicted nucleotidyltransferase|nr:MAG: hypothetical protein C4527_13030 [Candidatus Omnitrophota bacterium]